MDIPVSMQPELAAWNNGAGIDLESWIGCEGRFALAVGYSSIFWPQFVEFDGFILQKGFSEQTLRSFETSGRSRKSVEWVMNHLHIADIQHRFCEDIARDKILLLGRILKEIYEAKLQWKFPTRPCTVDFYIPEDEDDLREYQISLWQKCHET